jgi:hypothetical protein
MDRHGSAEQRWGTLLNNPVWDLGNFDRAAAPFCGFSPVYDDSQKAAALALVDQFANGTGTWGNKCAWKHIDKVAFAAGLRDRIKEPDDINQAGTPLCGPASFTRAVAKTQPLAYARAACDLYATGAAQIGNLKFKAGRELLGAMIPAAAGDSNGPMNPADWTMLCALRDDDNWFLSPAGWFSPAGPFPDAAGITTPHTVERWLRESGFTDILNMTYLFFQPKNVNFVVELEAANHRLMDGSFVFLFIDSDMLYWNKQTGHSFTPDHWVTLTAAFVKNQKSSHLTEITPTDTLNFTVYSWGEGHRQVPQVPYIPLTEERFLAKYYGFVAARWVY